MIIRKDMKGHFTTPDSDGDMSHSDILSALGWEENTNTHLRNFVRVQCPDWKIKSFEFDEDSTLPAWAEENKDEIIGIVKKALRRATPAWAEYEKVHDAALAEYEKVSDAAWAEYHKVHDAAWAEYEKVRDAAWAEYHKVSAPAWAEFVAKLSKISGFVS
jgi:hypothetical protein